MARQDGEPAPEYPTESCLFGLEVSPELDLPELLVLLGRRGKAFGVLFGFGRGVWNRE